MEQLFYVINLIFIFVLNVLFFFSGICLNSLVLISFWRSVQLRKKLCYFMIMVLSGCDLLAVLTNNPLQALITMLWLNNVFPNWTDMALNTSSSFLAFSLLNLLVMTFDRYLATSYPIFHRTSVTKRKLLTLFVILVTLQVTLHSMAVNFVISYQSALLLGIGVIILMLFMNYKLFRVTMKPRKNKLVVDTERPFSFKISSSCVLAFACFITVSVPFCVYTGLRKSSKDENITLNGVSVLRLWARTIVSMNSTFNCLIFYWKNKLLRSEGMKVLKSIKISWWARSDTIQYSLRNFGSVWRANPFLTCEALNCRENLYEQIRDGNIK